MHSCHCTHFLMVCAVFVHLNTCTCRHWLSISLPRESRHGLITLFLLFRWWQATTDFAIWQSRIMARQRKQKEMFQGGHSVPLISQLGRETQGLKKSPAVKSNVNVACFGNLQISEVLEDIKDVPFQIITFGYGRDPKMQRVAQTRSSAWAILHATVRFKFKKKT